MADEGTSSWRIVYQHLLHVESHWTAQVQHQQSRNAALVSVNGLVLGFVGLEGLQRFEESWEPVLRACFMGGLAALTIALVLGIIAMWSRVGIEGDGWLYPDTLKLGPGAPEQTYAALAQLLARSLRNTNHEDVLKSRRALILAQVFLIGVGLLLLGVAAAYLPDAVSVVPEA